MDEKGRIYIADAFNARVQIFSAKGVFPRSFSTSDSDKTAYAWHNIAYRYGRIYVTDVNLSGNNTAVFGANGNLLKTFSKAGRGVNEYIWAACIDADKKGNFYVPDASLRKILKFDGVGDYVKDINQSVFFALDQKGRIYLSRAPDYTEITVQDTSAADYEVVRFVKLPFAGSPERVDNIRQYVFYRRQRSNETFRRRQGNCEA